MADLVAASAKLNEPFYRARIHRLFRLRLWGVFLAAVSLICAASALIGTLSALPYAAVAIVAAASIFVRAILPLWTLKICLTSHRLMLKRGFISRSIQDLELHTIEEIDVSQNLWGRIFGYGTVCIRSIGRDPLILSRIARPIEFKNTIEAAIAGLAKSVHPSEHAQALHTR